MISSKRLLGAHLSIAGGLDKALDRAAALDITALQIFTRNQVQWRAPALDPAEVERFHEKLSASRIGYLCAHTSYLINLASPDELIRRKSVAALVTEVQRAETLKCRSVVLHPGSPKTDGKEVGLERIAAGLETVLLQTAECNVSIALENTAGQGASIGAELKQLNDLLDRLARHDRLQVCLDTCHAFAAGYDLSHVEGVHLFAETCIRMFGLERIALLHLNDCKSELGKHLDRHTHIGEGKIGCSGFRAILQEPLLKQVPGVLETPKENNDMSADQRNLQTLRQLERENQA